MATISLKDMKFYAYHGYYDFERRIGNNFQVDVDIDIAMDQDPNDHIDNTYNYEHAHNIITEHMQKKYQLLEGLAYDMATAIKNSDHIVQKVRITLSKSNPPLKGKVGRAQVTIEV
jgi:dihydroneopterin aldolase